MTSSPRDRRRDARRQRADAARPQRSAPPAWLLGVLACLLVGGGAIVVAASGDDSTATTTTGRGDPIPEPTGPGATFASGPPASLVPPTTGLAATGAVPCPATDGSSPRTTSFTEPPPDCLEPGVTYTAIVETTKGPLRILLNQEASPQAVNSFVFLARYHYYDDTPFTLVAPRGILQTGDPVGDPPGTGDPGYLLPAEIDPAFPPIYPTLTVAAVAEPPDNDHVGSEFFIAVGDEATALDPVHPVLGLLTDGMDAARAIEAVGDPETKRPTEDVRITSVEIVES